MALGLLTWSALGGLVADLWLDALSMLVVAPTMIALATMAWRQTSAEAFQAEQVWTEEIDKRKKRHWLLPAMQWL